MVFVDPMRRTLEIDNDRDCERNSGCLDVIWYDIGWFVCLMLAGLCVFIVAIKVGVLSVVGAVALLWE